MVLVVPVSYLTQNITDLQLPAELIILYALKDMYVQNTDINYFFRLE